MKLTIKEMENLGLIKRKSKLIFSNASFDTVGVNITRDNGKIERWLVCWDYERNCEAYQPKEPYDSKVRK